MMLTRVVALAALTALVQGANICMRLHHSFESGLESEWFNLHPDGYEAHTLTAVGRNGLSWTGECLAYTAEGTNMKKCKGEYGNTPQTSCDDCIADGTCIHGFCPTLGQSRDASGNCVFTGCDTPFNPCGPHGVCSSANGVVTCACTEGYLKDATGMCLECDGPNGYFEELSQSGTLCLAPRCLEFDTPFIISPAGSGTKHLGTATFECSAGYTPSKPLLCVMGEWNPDDTIPPYCKSPCDAYPCQNGAACIISPAQPTGYQCLCRPGFEGTLCETDINECATNPCGQTGTCTDRVNAYTCTCADGWHGFNCELTLAGCSENLFACGSYGTCVDQLPPKVGYVCNCFEGYQSVNGDQCKLIDCKLLRAAGQSSGEHTISLDTGCLFDYEADYPGNDYKVVPDVSSTQACQRLCFGEAQCNFWTYIIPDPPADDETGEESTYTASFKNCYLKTAKTTETVVPYRWMASGPKICGIVSKYGVYCDMMAPEPSAYTFFLVTDGIVTSSALDYNSCTAYGMDIYIPRTQHHFQRVYAYSLLKGGSMLDNMHPWGVIRPAPGCGVCKSKPMNYLSHAFEPVEDRWLALDGGLWWMRDTPYSEPNGDYGANVWLGIRAVNPSMVDFTFNDITSGYASGSRYICSDNAYPGEVQAANSCEELRLLQGIQQSGVFTIQTSEGPRELNCLFKNGRMWTQVYKIARSSTMMSTAEYNPAGLSTAHSSTAVGKLSDTVIKQLCTGQYFVHQITHQTGNCNGELYCRFENIGDFADNVKPAKKCSRTYSTEPLTGYTLSTRSSDGWAWNFGSWSHSGAMITQLDYRDSRKGSHIQQGCGSRLECRGSGGCHLNVYCLQ